MKMRIAILASARTSISAPFAGGLEMHSSLLAEGLTAKGHDVTVFASAGSGDFQLEPLRPIERPVDDTSRHDLCVHPASALSESDSYLDAMMRIGASDYDVVHLNTVHYLPFACSAMVPGVVTGTLHTPPYPWLVTALNAAAKGINPISIANVSVTNASLWDRSGLMDTMIHNGVDLDRWRFGDGGPSAVWTGRLVAEKAPHLAIDAARAAGMSLRLFGPVHDEDYFAGVIAPRLGGGIEYAGHGTVETLARAVASAGVAVVTPTWDEPFGLIVAEALACGTPVAAFDRGAMAELIGPDDGHLAQPGDIDSLARAMRAATRIDRAGCRRSAERRFSATRMIDEYEHWFERQLARRDGSRILHLVSDCVVDDRGDTTDEADPRSSGRRSGRGGTRI